MSAAPWTADEWAAIVWHARNARRNARSTSWRISPRKSAKHLQELALQTEIQGVPGCAQ
jgi:hypothetical protein